jgi:hypothetical protein
MSTPNASAKTASRIPGGARGIAILEFAILLPIIVIMAFGVFEFGFLIQSRLVISNVSREGGSIASRQTTIDPALINMLLATGKPLDLGGAYGKVIVTRITAGQTAAAPNPTITTQLSGGGLTMNSGIAGDNVNLGLPGNLYNHLVFNRDHGTSDISEITVVEVYYRYRTITPLPRFLSGVILPDGKSLVMGSKAIF